MPAAKPKIFPLGDNALVVEFGCKISIYLNERSIALANYLDSNPFAGYIESVPAYASAAVFYDTYQVRRANPSINSAFQHVKSHVESVLQRLPETVGGESRVIEIAVSFDAGDAPDLPFVAKKAGLKENEVVEIFTSVDYRVFMLGFLPGFAYLGEISPMIATSRKETPRLKTPKGSVGIAGRQTGVYPFESPGGWQIIGRTYVEMFDPKTDPPCYLRPGDTVRFIPV
jgi:inhibitor of KinA